MEPNRIKKFNIRVYLLFIEGGKVLLSDEILAGKCCTKFPGVGLELGESAIECAHREAMEELDSNIEVIEHFFTTDEFVPSTFRDEDQIISIYYRCSFKGEMKFRNALAKFDFLTFEEREESFRWAAIDELVSEEMTFAMDRKVVSMLIKQG